MESVNFALINVGTGIIVSYILSHYLLPILFDTERDTSRSIKITLIFTVAALIRNIIIYEIFTL